MSDFDPRIFDDEEAVAWLAGAFAGFLLRKPWKVDDEESTIRENRADVREAIQHALNNPEWVERSLETSLSQSVDLGERAALKLRTPEMLAALPLLLSRKEPTDG